MLIIEGTDLVGKTTLCKRLMALANERAPDYGLAPNAIYAHFSRLPQGWHYPQDYAPRIVGSTIMDRFHMSEIAYCHARGDEQKLSSNGYRLVDAWLGTVGAVTVVLTATAKWLADQWEVVMEDGRAEMYDLDVVQKADRAFRALLRMGGVPFEFELLGAYLPQWDFQYPVESRGWAAEDDTFCDHVVDAWLRRRQEILESLQ